MITFIAQWMTLSKAGQPGWALLIPIYNLIVVSRMVWGSGGKIFLMLVPIYNIYFAFKHNIAFANAFGKSNGFGVAMTFFPFLIWAIGFDKNVTYRGPQS